MTLKVATAGVGSDTAAATALILIECLPKASRFVVNGERHRLNGLPSILHSKAAGESVDLNRSVGVRSLVLAGGLPVIVVCGI